MHTYSTVNMIVTVISFDFQTVPKYQTMSIFSLNKHSEKREITPNKMHSYAKIKALKIYNWEEIFNRRQNCQNCNYLSSSTATNIRSGIKCRLQTLHRATLKMDLKNPQQKLNHIPKCWTAKYMIQMTLLLMLFWENKTRSYIHSSIQYHVVCSWNIIICPTSNVPANIYLLYIRLSVLQRLDVKCHISSCRLTWDLFFYLSA